MNELESLAHGGEYAVSRAEAQSLALSPDAAPGAGGRWVTARAMATPLAAALGSLLLFTLSLSVAARGLVPPWLGGAAITGSYVAAVAAIFHASRSFGLLADEGAGLSRPLLRRHGFWLVALAGALYLPTLGLPSLWDPWESHYGEVSREILVRSDWISLWWAHEGFFYSKPVLLFWLQAIAMAVTGVRVAPGHVLDGGAHPEWVIRMPNALLAVLGLYLLYRGAAKAFGRRAAMLGALVLTTCPFWVFMAHQATTDMTYVGPMTGSFGLLLCGLYTPADEQARTYEVRIGSRILRLSAWHLVLGAIVACAVPQALYLLSRNVDVLLTGSGPHGFRWHADYFMSGSGGGNCGEPGNSPCTTASPAFGLPPFAQGLAWLLGTVTLLKLQWKERRAQRLYYLGAWLFAAIATLAKGPAGLGLPALAALGTVAATRRWRLLLDAEIVSALLIVAVVALPWYVAAYVRHGAAFSDELLFHDMVNRAFSHVHDTNEGEDTSFIYYATQLGYGLFPWVGLAPLGLVAWMRRDDREPSTWADGAILLFLWFLVAFALFSFMGTKFHHYIFPAVPPVAMLIGLALDSVFERGSHLLGAAAAAGALLVGLVTRDLVTRSPGEHDGAIHFAQLFSYQYHRPWPAMLDFGTTLAIFGGAAAVLLLLASAQRLRRPAIAATFVLAALLAVWCGDVYLMKTGRHWGQGDVIRAYYASRASEAEPLVAYQMNWKGENFYTGNRVPAFKSSGAPFVQWLREQRERGTKVMFFVVEHSRVSALEGEAQAHAWRAITTRDDSHQFVLMRAEL
jgi:4-amino-4-deoxy-L-arabinose transferase-like glycosyltransferase